VSWGGETGLTRTQTNAPTAFGSGCGVATAVRESATALSPKPAIEFVLLQNGECIANNYKPLWDELGQALGPYPTGPTAETLAPR